MRPGTLRLTWQPACNLPNSRVSLPVSLTASAFRGFRQWRPDDRHPSTPSSSERAQRAKAGERVRRLSTAMRHSRLHRLRGRPDPGGDQAAAVWSISTRAYAATARRRRAERGCGGKSDADPRELTTGPGVAGQGTHVNSMADFEQIGWHVLGASGAALSRRTADPLAVGPAGCDRPRGRSHAHARLPCAASVLTGWRGRRARLCDRLPRRSQRPTARSRRLRRAAQAMEPLAPFAERCDQAVCGRWKCCMLAARGDVSRRKAGSTSKPAGRYSRPGGSPSATPGRRADMIDPSRTDCRFAVTASVVGRGGRIGGPRLAWVLCPATRA
jgi:hypothetical protein